MGARQERLRVSSSPHDTQPNSHASSMPPNVSWITAYERATGHRDGHMPRSADNTVVLAFEAYVRSTSPVRRMVSRHLHAYPCLMADPIAQRARNTPGGVAAGFEGKHHVQRTAQLDLHRWQCIRRVHVRTVAQQKCIPANGGPALHLPAIAGAMRI